MSNFATMNSKKKILRIVAPTLGFVVPYVVREMPEWQVVTDGDEAARPDAVTVLLVPGEALPADVPADATVLECPNVVGTGMGGYPMLVARHIASGTYFHTDDAEARLSTIHASDVAVAVRLSVGMPGRWTVTDLADPSWHDFAEAISHRLGDKRIFTLRPRWARWIMNSDLRRLTTTDCLYDGKAFAERFGFRPTPVTTYLTAHVYDDESL